VAIAFDNDPAILGAITAILALQIVVGLLASSWAGREQGPAAGSPAVGPAK
jgi:BASS family bile acid:Na+ symporter